MSYLINSRIPSLAYANKDQRQKRHIKNINVLNTYTRICRFPKALFSIRLK